MGIPIKMPAYRWVLYMATYLCPLPADVEVNTACIHNVKPKLLHTEGFIVVVFVCLFSNFLTKSD